MKRQNGFTLIELVIVIIVLGILAATAVPKFINLQDDARVSAMEGVEASIHSAANLVYSRAAIDNVETAASGKTVDVAGTKVDLILGYPDDSTTGILAALELSGFEGLRSSAPVGFMFFAAGNTGVVDSLCLLYSEATSTASYSVTKGRIIANGCDISGNKGNW